MKFTHKIFLMPLLAAVAFAVVFMVVRRGTNDDRALLAQVEGGNFREFALGLHLERTVLQIRQILLNATYLEEIAEIEEADTYREIFTGLIAAGRAEPLVDHQTLDRLEGAFLEYYDLARSTTVDLIEKGYDKLEEDDYARFAQKVEREEALLEELRRVTQANDAGMKRAFDTMWEQQERRARSVHVTIVLALLTLVALSLGVIASVVRPLRSITRATEAIADGKLDETIDYRSQDDLGRLAGSFRCMQQSLSDEFERRSRAESALRLSEERLELAFHVASDGLWDYDVPNESLYMSPRFFELLGYEPEELGDTMRMIQEITHPEDAAETEAAYVAHLRTGEPIDIEHRVRRKDGTWCWIHVRGEVVENDLRGRPRRSIGACTDITLRKEAEEQLAIAQQELVDAAHSAGMAEIATSVLHNVGNVLNAATTSAGVLSRTLAQSRVNTLVRLADVVHAHAEDFPEYVRNDPQGRKLPGFLGQLAEVVAGEWKRLGEEVANITKSHDHIKDIIAIQQSYAGVSGVTEDVSPTVLIEDAVHLLGASFERHHIRFSVDADPTLRSIRVEKHKVMQILINLLKNARDALKEHGGERRILVRVDRKSDSEITISVVDNGIGISAENLERVFTYGFTTKPDGHGYGLHGSANAAREMGGSLTVSSDGPGRGATFTLTLPRNEDTVTRRRA